MVRPEMSIEQVQKWVVTALICAVATFPLGALIAVTHTSHADDPAGAALLAGMTGVLGVVAVGAARLVHRLPPVSPMLLLGLLPAVGSVLWTWS